MPPLPPPPPPPEPPLLFRPKSLVREKLFPSARPIARAIVRVPSAEGMRAGAAARARPSRGPPLDEDDALVPSGAPARDWLRVTAPRPWRRAGADHPDPGGGGGAL